MMKIKNMDKNHIDGWAMSQSLPLNVFKWFGNTSQFTKDFIKNYNEDSGGCYFLEIDVQHSENLHNLYNDLLFFSLKNKN